MACQQLMVMGTSASSGKTILSVGLCRLLANAGLRVVPFKAIAVAKAGENHDDQPSAAGIVHHLRACRTQFDPAMNPILLVPTASGEGELYLHGRPCGRAPYGGEDIVLLPRVDPMLRTRIRAAVRASYRALAGTADVLVIEGAASPIDLEEADDIANIEVARLTGAPIVMSSQMLQGGSVGGLIGTMRCLPADVRARVRGYVLGAVRHAELAAVVRRRVEEHCGLPQVGQIGRLTVFDGPPSTRPTEHDMYDIWADAVREGVDLDRLLTGEPAARLGRVSGGPAVAEVG